MTSTAGPAVPAAGVYRLDPMHTFAEFSVKHLVVGRIDGRFNAIEGGFVVTEDPDQAFDEVDVSIQAASIDTNHEVRDEDLRGPRFFDASSFASLTFRSERSRRAGDSTWNVLGDLAIRGVTRPVAFDVVVRGTAVDQRGRSKLAATATTDLTRPDFDLTTELELESGTGGGPDVWVRVDIEATLQQESPS